MSEAYDWLLGGRLRAKCRDQRTGTEMTDEERLVKEREAAEAILGKPFAAAMSEATEKIRRNLLVVSAITVAIVILGVRVAPTNTLLGISFEGLTADALKKGLLAVNTYMLLHFLWCMLDELQEWRLRVSGTRSAYITGASPFGSQHADYPVEPRQSTLHNWWRTAAVRFVPVDEAVQRLDAAFKQLIAMEEEMKRNGREPESASVEGRIGATIATDISTLLNAVNQTKAVLTSERVNISLKRFDNAFQLFLRSQNLRWLVIDAGFPLLFGLASLAILVRDLYFGA